MVTARRRLELRTVALALALLASDVGARTTCSFFARVQGTRNDAGEWTRVEPLNVDEFFARGPAEELCSASLGEFGIESIFQFSPEPGIPSVTLFLVDVPFHVLEEAIVVYGSLESLEFAVEAAGGTLEESIAGTGIPGGLPLGMTVNARLFFVEAALFAEPLSVAFENPTEPGGPIGTVLGLGSRDLVCGRTCGDGTMDNQDAVRVFYHFSNEEGPGTIRTTMEIETIEPGIDRLTASTVVPCACGRRCIPD